MAQLTTKRLHELLVLCWQSQVKEKNREWFLALKSLSIELTPYTAQDHSRLFLDSFKGSCEVKTNIRNKQREYIYDVEKLADAQKVLMMVMHKKGLLMPSADDPGQAMLK